MLLHNNNNKETKSWASLEYCSGISGKKLGKYFTKNNVKLCYKTNNVYKNQFQNLEHKTKKLNCSGIYELNCDYASK